ncbi:MAG: hypothetical protein IPM60_11320 [Rhodospirillales bacterium]|nr:hypothetical protein [Rhodospirillales bacterium]
MTVTRSDNFMPEPCRSLFEHELKTPLTSMRSAAEILRDNQDLPPAERDRFLDALIEDNVRLEAIINRMLSAAQGHPPSASPDCLQPGRA